MLVATTLCAVTNGAVGGLCVLKSFLITETGGESSAEIVSWVQAVLVMFFMFLVGISMTGFPWILMGKLRIEVKGLGLSFKLVFSYVNDYVNHPPTVVSVSFEKKQTIFS